MKKLLLISCFIMCNMICAYSQSENRYAGGDISLLPSYEASSTVYLDKNGNAIPDLITWLVQECGWNTFRVRLFVDPQQKNQKGATDYAVCQNLDYVKELGKRIKDAGAQFMLDFHYSDTWADPSYQILPSSWSSCTTVASKAQKVYSYTKECLNTLKAYGAEPDFVQVGNEITSAIVGVSRSSDAAGFKSIVEKGCDAVREVCPDAQIIIHIERPQNTTNVINFYKALDASKFDIIGLSYYPIWHGYLTDLATTLNSLETNFPTKKVQIVETAYNFQYWPTSGVTYNTQNLWACSDAGQNKFLKELIAELKLHSNVNGVLYWFPEEAGNGDAVNWDTKEGIVIESWVNRGLWWSSNSNGGHWPLTVNGSETAKLLGDYGQITAVESVESDATPNTSTYNLAGQKVSPSTPGILVRNGKKFLK